MSTSAFKENNTNLIWNEDESIVTYEKLNIDNEEDVIEFEKALYKEFMERNPDSWITKNYIKIDNCRFKIPMDYNDLGIYVVKKKKIIMSVALNFNMNITLLLEKKGFTNLYKDNETAEGILFFSVQSELKRLNFFKIAENLFIMAKKDYTKKKLIKRIFLTCTKEFLNLYKLMNFQPVWKIVRDGEEKYLLCFFI